MDVELGKKLEKLKDVEVGHKRKLGGVWPSLSLSSGFS
jgi:hypothetical protein